VTAAAHTAMSACRHVGTARRVNGSVRHEGRDVGRQPNDRDAHTAGGHTRSHSAMKHDNNCARRRTDSAIFGAGFAGSAAGAAGAAAEGAVTAADGSPACCGGAVDVGSTHTPMYLTLPSARWSVRKPHLRAQLERGKLKRGRSHRLEETGGGQQPNSSVRADARFTRAEQNRT
jgi:hypothetical protein